MIKAIIFDVGGVLIDNPWPEMRSHYAKHLNVNEEKFDEVYREVVAEWQRGELSEKDFWKKMTKMLKTNMPRSESLWLDGFKATYREKEEIFNLIKSLKERKYKIGLLSNTEIPIMHFLVKQKYEHFDVFIFSCDVGVIKPDSEIYEAILKRLDVKPDKAVFTDDKEENIITATKLGIHGIQYKNSEQVISSLEKILTR